MFRLASPVAVIVEIQAGRFTSTAVPTKHQSPLLIYPNRMEPSEIAAQLFEVVAGRRAEILIGGGVVDHLQLPKEAARKVGRDISRRNVLDKEEAQPIVPKANDHSAPSTALQCTALWFKMQLPGIIIASPRSGS
jgi:hypothetical protein